MAVRLREADNIAAMAELQQQVSELEIEVKSKHTPCYVSNIPLTPDSASSILFPRLQTTFIIQPQLRKSCDGMEDAT